MQQQLKHSEQTQKTNKSSDDLILPKPNPKETSTKDPKLESKLQKIQNLALPADKLGGRDDHIYKELEKSVEGLTKKNTPSLIDQLDNLHRDVQGKDVPELLQKIQSFQSDMRGKNDNTKLPKETQEIKNDFDQLKKDLAPESPLRQYSKEVKKESGNDIFPGIIKLRYKTLTEKIHALEKADKKAP